MNFANLGESESSEPQAASPGEVGESTPDGADAPEEVAKKKREDLRASVLKSAQGLQLQSVVIRGNQRAALISNALYHEGEAVDGFLIEKISPNSVVVRKETYRLELKMSK